MLVAEDLVGLVWDGVAGRALVPIAALDVALVGAAVLELRSRQLVACDDVLRLSRVGTATTGDEPLDRVLRSLGSRRQLTIDQVVDHDVEEMAHLVLVGMCGKGLATRQERHVLGFTREPRWDLTPACPARSTVRAIHDALLHGARPDQRTRALLTLLTGLDCVGAVVPVGIDLTQVQLRARARRPALDDDLSLVLLELMDARRPADPWSGAPTPF